MSISGAESKRWTNAVAHVSLAGDEFGDSGEFVGVEVSFDFEVVVDLDVDPEAVVDAEGFGQA